MLNYEACATTSCEYTLGIQISGSGPPVNTTASITITNVNEVPLFSDATVTLDENTPSGSDVVNFTIS